MSTVIHTEPGNPGSVPTHLEPGQLAVDVDQRVAYLAKTDGSIAKVFDQYSKDEMDAKYIPNGIVPVTRVGDTPYLPLDVKGDFKGSVVPTRPTYVLREPDGSVAGLRPGYNGNLTGAFYFYSPSGRTDTEDDFIYTDTQYEPNFLRKDSTAVEYVSYVSNSNQYGFLASIKSRLDNTWQRWYWIHTNGTLDPLFHSYVDVTDTMTSNNLLSLQYIKEFNGFWGTAPDRIRVSFFNNDLPLNWVNNPSPTSTTLTQKTVNCVDPVSGTTSALTQWLNYNSSNYSAVYKPLSPTSDWSLISVGFPASSSIVTSNKYCVNYQMGDDGNTLNMWITYSIQNVYNVGILYSTLIMRIRYNIATNTVSWFLPGNSPADQALPFVFNPTTYTVDNNTSTGTPTSDAYKENKYPLQFITCADGAQWHVSTPDSYNFIDDRTVLISSYTYSFLYFALQNVDVSASPRVNKLNSFAERPRFGQNRPQDYQVSRSSMVLYPYDASILGKNLGYLTFLSRYRIGVNSRSRRFGQGLEDNKVICTLPDVAVSRTLDFAGAPNALKIPATTTLRENTPGLTNVPELYELSSCTNSIIYANGDFRVMPYVTSTRTLYHDQNVWKVDGAVIKVVDGENYAYDATRGGSAGYVIMPQNVTAAVPAIIANFKAASTLNFGATFTFSNWSLFYVGDYTNGGVNYGICVLQYSIQSVQQGTEFGLATLRLVKTGKQMAFQSNPVLDIVSTQKNTNTTPAPGGDSPPYEAPTCGVLQYTDGRFFIQLSSMAVGVIGNTLIYASTLEISANGTITRSKLQWRADNYYYGTNSGVHPDFGLYLTTARLDMSTARTSIVYVPNAATPGVAKTFASFDNMLGTSTTLTDSWMLTVEAAQGFNLYLSQFSSFINGRKYQIPTMTIDLSTLVPDPKSKTFYVYLDAVSDTQLNMVIQLTTLPETFTRVYIGTITTDVTGITNVDLQKITRVDTYRPSHKPYVGSAMPVPV